MKKIIPFWGLMLFALPKSNTTSNPGQMWFAPSKYETPKPALIDVYYAAKIVHSEARGESEEGKRAVCDVIRQRAKWKGITIAESCFIGFDGATNKAFFDPIPQSTVKLVKEVLQSKQKYKYRFFLNFNSATDKNFVSLAYKAKAQNKGIQIGNHFFFNL